MRGIKSSRRLEGPSLPAELRHLGMNLFCRPPEACRGLLLCLPLSCPSAPQLQGSKHGSAALLLLPRAAQFPGFRPLPFAVPRAQWPGWLPHYLPTAERVFLPLQVSHTPGSHSCSKREKTPQPIRDVWPWVSNPTALSLCLLICRWDSQESPGTHLLDML